MPNSAPRVCGKCQKSSVICKCPKHKWGNKRNRKESNKLYHCKRWRMTREAVLRRDSHLCQMCKKQIATHVDHIKGAANNPAWVSTFYDVQGLQALCPPCHSHKTSTIDSK